MTLALAGGSDGGDDGRDKAERFFHYARTAADTASYDYAITLYLEGLQHAIDHLPAHQALRDAPLRRKSAGGAAFAMTDKTKLRPLAAKDNPAALLAAERLLAFDPGNTDL